MKRVKRTLVLLLTLAMLLSMAAPTFASEYVVKAGDNLSKIARELLGSASKWREIYNANKDKIKDPNLIYVGQTLTIPDGEPAPTAEPTPDVTPEPSDAPIEDTRLPATVSYIPAPYVTNADHLTDEVLDPAFYENEDGPTIGVTLLGVITVDGKYFRDINNNGVLDTFEDWRLDDQTRAEAMAAAMSDFQLTHQVFNVMAYSPKSTKTAAVVDENGKPVWTKLYSATGGFGGGSDPNATNINYLNTSGMRTFVLRNNPETEVAVWFNNGLEQYAEWDAIAKGEVAVPYTQYTNPINHGMPTSFGVTAAALGDGNADLVLTDAQYDRIVMWAKGIDGIYGPQIDLVTDPRWSRNYTTYGERVDMAEEIAHNLVAGYQNGTNGMVEGSVLLTVKHFPGDGAAYNGFESHGQAGRYRVYTTENSLANYQLKPFIAAFEAGAAGIMPGYSQPIVDDRIAPQSITYNDKTYDIRFDGRGNAWNEDILLTLARDILGFKGVINSDSLGGGSSHGVDDLSEVEKAALFVKAGCDAGVSGISTDELVKALETGLLTRADLERAAANRILPHIQSGNLDNPYRDMEESVKAVSEVTPKVEKLVEETNLKSVVLMKNHESALPLQTSTKVYIEGFNDKDNFDTADMVAKMTAEGFTVVEKAEEADAIVLVLKPTGPQQGKNWLGVIDLVEDVETPTYDNEAKPDGDTYTVTTLANVDKIAKIANAAHTAGKKVIGVINITAPWILTNLEPYCDALLATFDNESGGFQAAAPTSPAAVAKIIAGKYNPTGKLPVTMVADESVIALEKKDFNGETWEVCVSPNDVPGYEKEKYMDPAVLAASPSGSYAYKDADGNFYWSDFGLCYDTRLPATESYIPAPYLATNENQLTDEVLDPAFYENEDGPTIGVTLLGVITVDGKYFRDINNNGVLDTFEDWRLDDQTRAEAMAAAMSDFQLTHQVFNVMAYSPKSTKTAAVVDENGKPVWTKLYSATGGFGGGSDPNATNINYLNTSGMRTFVLRNNPETEVAVWFNNGLEQYAEWDAIAKGEVAVPYTQYTNPINHGMPTSFGVTAAALGDGNADLVLTDAQYDRIVMWAKGIDGIYGPQIDLVTDPRWSRNYTTYGERVDMAEEIAHNLVAGYQNGTNGMVEGSVLLTVKHFPGDGAAYNGFESHGQAGRYRVYTTENSLANYQLKPFIAAFEAGAAGIMPGYSQPIVDARIAPQSITYNGVTTDIRYEGRGNAFNPDILLGLARNVLGFEGLINSDSLMVNSQQGVEDLSSYERMVLFVKAGCDCGVISFNDADPAELLNQALANGDLTRADLERAAYNRILPRIQSGDLDNPYRDLEESVKAVSEVTPKVQALAEETHLKSVVLMKNTGSTLPLKDTGKTVYIRGFNAKDNAKVDGIVKEFEAKGFTVVDDYEKADIAYLRVSPTLVGQGSSQLAILDLGEDFETPVYDNNAKRTGETATIATVADMKTFQKIAETVHANGGKVIGEITATSPWILTNMEPYCDALIGTFSTKDAAIAKVLVGEYNPTGKLPITMVADASVIKLVETNLDGEIWDVCVSPNDVPGYVKDQYMDPAVLAASPSGSYAYKDAAGNLYVSGFGLRY